MRVKITKKTKTVTGGIVYVKAKDKVKAFERAFNKVLKMAFKVSQKEQK